MRGVDLRIAVGLLGDVVEFAERIEHGAAALRIETLGVRQEENWIAGSAEANALILRGQEAARPEARK